MKKVLLFIILMLTSVFLFTACKSGESEIYDSQGSKDETKMMGQSAELLSCDDGELKYIGFQKADPKLTDEDNAYVFVFEYTNHKEEPSECYSTFNLSFFQNSSELSDEVSYSTAAKEQSELVHAFFNKALKDGSVRFGQLVIAKDDNPITVMAQEIGNKKHYEMIEVNLNDGSVSQ